MVAFLGASTGSRWCTSSVACDMWDPPGPGVEPVPPGLGKTDSQPLARRKSLRGLFSGLSELIPKHSADLGITMNISWAPTKGQVFLGPGYTAGDKAD